MMTNLFSIFDPCSLKFFSLNWGFVFFFVFFFLFTKNTLVSGGLAIKKEALNLIILDLSAGMKNLLFLLIFFVSLFFFFMVNNYLGLMPYIFPVTSHMSLGLNMSLIFWVAMFFFNLTFNMKNYLSHLAPEETSYFLLPLMVIIETLSNLMRPFTLAIRMSANMIAGHLLLVLVSGFLSQVSMIGFPILYFGTTALILLETMVMVIQAYIFTMLMSLYFSE